MVFLRPSISDSLLVAAHVNTKDKKQKVQKKATTGFIRFSRILFREKWQAGFTSFVERKSNRYANVQTSLSI